MKLWIKTTTLAAFSLAAVTGLSQEIYAPTRTAKDQGIALSSWGSGTIKEADEAAFEGATSIRVSSRNYFQGGIVKFSKAVNVGSSFADKNNLLQFMVLVPGASKTFGGGAPGGKFGGGGFPGAGGPPGVGGGRGPAGAGGAGAGGGGRGPAGAGGAGAGGGGRGPAGAGGAGAGGQRGPGGFPGAGGGVPGFPGRGGAAGQTNNEVPALSHVRVVIGTSDGKMSEAYVDLSSTFPDKNGWAPAGIPLQAINGFERTNKEIVSIAFAGDSVSTFYIGQIKVVNDPTAIYGEMNTRADLNLAIGDEYTFVGNGFGGATALKYEWCFDSANFDGVDAEGQTVTRRFRKPGDYVVKLTIRDAYGLKKPYSTTIKVTVNP